MRPKVSGDFLNCRDEGLVEDGRLRTPTRVESRDCEPAYNVAKGLPLHQYQLTSRQCRPRYIGQDFDNGDCFQRRVFRQKEDGLPVDGIPFTCCPHALAHFERAKRRIVTTTVRGGNVAPVDGTSRGGDTGQGDATAVRKQNVRIIPFYSAPGSMRSQRVRSHPKSKIELLLTGRTEVHDGTSLSCGAVSAERHSSRCVCIYVYTIESSSKRGNCS